MRLGWGGKEVRVVGAILFFLLLVDWSLSETQEQKQILVCALVTVPSIEEELSNGTYVGLYDPQSINMVEGWTMWRDSINSRGGIMIGNLTYSVNLTIINVGQTTQKVKSVGLDAARGFYGNCTFLLAPFSSGLTEALAPISEQFQIPTISGFAASPMTWRCSEPLLPPCTTDRSRRYKWIWSTLPSAQFFFDGAFNILALKGAQTVVAWTSDEPYMRSLVEGALLSATSQGMTVLDNIVASVSPNTTEIVSLVQTLKSFSADIIISGNRKSETCIPYLLELKKQNVNPKAITVSQCVTSSAVRSALGSDIRYVLDTSLWDPRVRGPDFMDSRAFPPTVNKTSARLFSDTYKERFNKTVVDSWSNIASAFATGLVIESALEKVESLTPDEINEHLGLVFEPSLFGTLGFSVYGMNDGKAALIIQADETNTIQIVTPLSSATKIFIYPFPEWDKREWNSEYLGRTSEIVIFSLFAFCILFSICVSILLFKYWDAKNIKAGQRLFLAIMILGSVLVYLSVPFWMLHQNIWFCHLRYWFICIGFTLLFGTLTLKTFRIKSIFVSSLTLKSVRALTDLEMLIPIGLLVLIDFILCITWSLVLPPQLQLEVIDIYRPAFNYYQCTWSDKVNIPLILMLIYKLLMVIFGIYLSILLWKYGFGDSMFVESRQIIFSMYNLIICGVVGAALQITLKGYDSRETLFVARSICILLSGLVTIISILFPRFDDPYGIKHEGKDISGKPISEPKAVSRTTDYDQLLKKYEELRKSYEKLSQSTSAISHKLDDEYITLSTTSTNM